MFYEIIFNILTIRREASGIRPEVDEDDYDISDAATMKARAWDEYTEENPK